MMSLCRVIGLLTTFALRTTGAPTVGIPGTGCETSPAVVGGTGSMTFHFRQGLNMSSDIFHAYVIRSGDTANVLQCDRRNEAGITCESINQAFKTTTIVNHSLRLQAPHVTQDLAGNYTLWTTVGGPQERPVECRFVVRNETEGTPGEKTDVNVVPIVVPIVIMLLVVAAAAVVYIFFRRRNKRRSGSQKQHPLDDIDHSKIYDRSDDSGASSMLLTDENDAQRCDVTTKRWYFGSMSPEDEAELSHFKRRNKPSSFLVREEGPYLILAVCGDDSDNKHFRIDTDDGYNIEGTDETFDTLPHLIEHYRNNDIVHRGKTAGRLGNPFEVEPKEVWYAGKMRRRPEKKLFRSTGNQPNSFLLRDSITSPGDYTLAVYISKMKKPKHFLISLDVNSFNFCDANKKFKSLAELVHYYQANDIETTKDGNFGKLGTPIGARTTGCHCM